MRVQLNFFRVHNFLAPTRKVFEIASFVHMIEVACGDIYCKPSPGQSHAGVFFPSRDRGQRPASLPLTPLSPSWCTDWADERIDGV